MHRYIPGPNAEEGVPGGVIAYDDTDPKQAKVANHLAKEGGWYEVDSAGVHLASKPAPPAGDPPKDESPDASSTPAPEGTSLTPETEPAGTGDHEEGV